MCEILATPDSILQAIESAEPGDRVILEAGQYPSIAITWKHGAVDRPIEIFAKAGAVFDGGRRYEDFQQEANDLARELQENGKFPGVYPIADNGHVTFRNCRYVRLVGATFKGCWPTCVAIQDCSDIALADLTMEEASFAIYARGSRTSGILIERCSWLQDIERGRIWRDIPWSKIHGVQPVEPDDARAFDGDFFRAVGIRGGVTIRDCLVEHAFNGVHLFHSDGDGLNTNENRDVRVYRNRFRYVRDNAVEPEYGATNWWVFHNEIYNCHKWFSVECRRMGYTYWFGNTGWFDEIPTLSSGHNAGAVWKTPRDPKPTTGLNYVFHNSFYLRSKYIKKKRLRNIRHFNNAIQYCTQSDFSNGACDGPVGFFGDIAASGEGARFTKEWRDLNIRFQSDIVAHHEFPEVLVNGGYPIEDGLTDVPGFVNPMEGAFQLIEGAAASGRSISQSIELEDGERWALSAGLDLGAWQGDQKITPPAQAFSDFPSIT